MMQKIYFQHLGFKGNLFESFLIILSSIIVILNLFYLSEEHQDLPRIVRLIFLLPSLTFIYIFSKIFWYKNILQWNKKGMNIKINCRWPKNIRFDELSSALSN